MGKETKREEENYKSSKENSEDECEGSNLVECVYMIYTTTNAIYKCTDCNYTVKELLPLENSIEL